MSSNNYIQAEEQEDGSFTVREGDMDSGRPGAIVALGLTRQQADVFMRGWGHVEYGPYWYFLDNTDNE